MKRWPAILGGLLFCAMAHCATANPVEPKVLLFLWSLPGWSGPSGHDPLGLRLAIYDDGQVLLIDRTTQAPTPPHLSTAQIDSGAARRMAESIRQRLDGLPEHLVGDGSFSDMGSIYIQVWDDERRQYRLHSAYGFPCLPPGEAEPQEVSETPITKPEDIDKIDWAASFTNWTVRNRKGTDPRFTAACDALLAYRPTGVKPWVPKEFWVRVWRGQNEPREVLAWPTDWPPMPSAAAKGDTAAELCFRLAEPASAVTLEMRSDSRDDRRRAADTGFPIDATHWWLLGEWGYALPGEIRLLGEDDNSFDLAHGPCKTY